MSEGENKVAEIIFKDLIKELSRTKEKNIPQIQKATKYKQATQTHILYI